MKQNETKILRSTFKSTESKNVSQQSASKINESKELYQEIFKSFMKHL
jgi:hypothetical protein